MNKAELITALEPKLGSKKAASDALEHVLDVVIREVAKGGKVSITGFGTFQKVAREARTGRNPRTGAAVKIKKTTVPRFRPGTAFKAVVADPRKLPKTAIAGGRASAGSTTKAAPVKATAKKATPAKSAATKTTSARSTTKAAPAASAATKSAATKGAPAKSAATKATTKAAPAKSAATRTTKAATTKTATTKSAPSKTTTAKKTTTKAATPVKATTRRTAKKA